ncbi:hypothetical protein ACIRD8_17005 [Streptomyces sp. NPDC102451]|uniref:hypothetical protein n=1 Tax=Streptomyces sp. NPDC102451 TaxID=3366177 RepID=UPI0038109EC7
MPLQSSTERTLRGTYTVASDDPFLAGHFPGFPLVPGFLLFQYVHSLVSGAGAVDPTLPITLEKARFRSPVRPRVPVRAEATVRQEAGAAQVSASLTTAEGPVAQMRIRIGGAPARDSPGPARHGVPATPATTLPEIESLIPHRAPALLVDSVIHAEPGKRLHARRAAVACDAPSVTAAHGSSQVVPPGLVLESWAQSAVALACWTRPNPQVGTGLVTLLSGVRDARLLAPVPVGAVMEHECETVRDLGDTVITTGTCYADGRPVLEVGQLMLVLRAADTLAPHSPAARRSTQERS